MTLAGVSRGASWRSGWRAKRRVGCESRGGHTSRLRFDLHPDQSVSLLHQSRQNQRPNLHSATRRG